MNEISRMLKNEEFRMIVRSHISLFCGMITVMLKDAYPDLGYKVFLPIGIVALIVTNLVISKLAKR